MKLSRPCSEPLERRVMLAGDGGSISGRADVTLSSDLAVETTGNVLVCGTVGARAGLGRLFLARHDPAGEQLWATVADARVGFGPQAAVTSDGSIYVAATFRGQTDADPGPGEMLITSTGRTGLFLCKLGSQGDLVWAMPIPLRGSASVNELVAKNEGGVVIAGGFRGAMDLRQLGGPLLASQGKADGFVISMRPDGSVAWARQPGGPGSQTVSALAVDDAQHVYAGGSFTKALDAAVVTLYSAGAADGFIEQLDGGGAVGWAVRVDGRKADAVSALAAAGGAVVAGGSFAASADFDPGPDASPLTAVRHTDAFLLRLDAGAGGFAWAGRIGGRSDEALSHVALDASATVRTVMDVGNQVEVRGGEAGSPRTSDAEEPGLLLSTFTAGGTVLSTPRISTARFVNARGLAVGSGDRLYVLGDYLKAGRGGGGSLDLDPGEGVFNLAGPDSGSFVIVLNRLEEFENAFLV